MPYDAKNWSGQLGIAATEIIRLSESGVPNPVAQELIDMLESNPRKFHSSLCYDPDGSEFFERLCMQPEYYLTRVERKLLYKEASTLIEKVMPTQIVDLGCGNFEKTQILLHECVKQEGFVKFVPIDIDQSVIERSLDHLNHFYKSHVQVRALVACFEEALAYVKTSDERQLFTFLGSTLGNMSVPERESLFSAVSSTMTTEDYFLLGIDLVKQRDLLESAYNDAGGYLEANTMQILASLNNEYGGRFDRQKFKHVCRYEPEHRRVVSYIMSLEDQRVPVEKLGITLDLAAGEEIEAEFREKFVVHDVISDLDRYGMKPARVIVDDTMPYALLLLSKA